MHGNHPARLEVKKGAHGVGGVGVYVTKLRRIVGADGKESQFRSQTTSDLTEAWEIRRVAGVIHGMLTGLQNKTAVSTVRVFQDTRAPVAQIVVHNGGQRWAMQAIKVRVGNQHDVNGRKIGNAQSWPAKPFEHEQPTGKVRIDHHTLSADLQEKARMANEGYAELPVRSEARLVRLADARSHCRVPYQASKLGGAFAESRIAKRLLDHPYCAGAGSLPFKILVAS